MDVSIIKNKRIKHIIKNTYKKRHIIKSTYKKRFYTYTYKKQAKTKNSVSEDPRNEKKTQFKKLQIRFLFGVQISTAKHKSYVINEKCFVRTLGF